MKLLLFSNSKNYGQDYLQHAKPIIAAFLKNKPTNPLFIPYPNILDGYDAFLHKVKSSLNGTIHNLTSLHEYDDYIKIINNADLFMVGGGNTFQLLDKLHKMKRVQLFCAEDKNPVKLRSLAGMLHTEKHGCAQVPVLCERSNSRQGRRSTVVSEV